MRISGYLLPILLGCTALSAPSASFAQVSIDATITLAPPELPDYAQPPIPVVGYVWTPGWWQYGPAGYYWVPGTWVQPPAVGLLWTPGYWAWNNGRYFWNAPYWGSQVGYYGGINYGYGYGGNGYAGGRWNNGQFEYNRAVNNFGDTRIANAYSQTVVNATPFNHVSFNGGTGGVSLRPTVQQLAAAHEQHTAPLPVQAQHIQAAAADQALLASANHGHPLIAATSRPAVFSGQGVVASRGAVPTGNVQQQHATGAPGPPIVGHAGQPALRPAATAGAVPQQQAPVARGSAVEGRLPTAANRAAVAPALRQPETASRPSVPQQAIRSAPMNEDAAAPVGQPLRAPEARPLAPQQAIRSAPMNEHAVAPVGQPLRAPEARAAPPPQVHAAAPAVHAAARAPEVRAMAPPQAHAAPAAGHEEKPPG
jgi:hypothetical protein